MALTFDLFRIMEPEESECRPAVQIVLSDPPCRHVGAGVSSQRDGRLDGLLQHGLVTGNSFINAF